MYTIRVKAAPRQAASYAAVAAGSAADGGGASGSGQPSPSATPPPAGALAAAEAEEVDHVNFSAGNPRVEHMVGRVSLFRHLPPPGASAAAGTPVAGQHPAAQQQQQQQQQQQTASVLRSEIEPAASSDLASPTAARQHPDLPVRPQTVAEWGVGGHVVPAGRQSSAYQSMLRFAEGNSVIPL